jgi:hypothetical protein
MIHGIGALGEGARTSAAQARASIAHVLGGAAGGIATLAALWLLATPLRTLLPAPAPRVLVAAVAVAAFCTDLGILHPPKVYRQLPRSWARRFGADRLYFMYGVVLGSGLLTFAPYALVFTVLALFSLQDSLPLALAGGALLGAGRTVLVGPLSHPRVAPRRLMDDLAGGYRHLPKLSAAASILVVAFVVARPF